MRNKITLFILYFAVSILLFPIIKSAIAQEPVLNYSLVFSFGVEYDVEDFVLKKPTGMTVDLTGYFIITDNNRVKIFDKEGKPKTLFGGDGYEQGQFSSAHSPRTFKNGYIAVLDGNSSYQTFRSDGFFIESRNLAVDPRYNRYFNKTVLKTFLLDVVYLTTQKKIINLMCIMHDLGEGYVQFEALLLDDNTTVKVITERKSNSVLKTKTGDYVYRPFSGKLHWVLINDNTIAHTHTDIDKGTDYNGQPYYQLWFYNLDTGREKILEKNYQPVLVQDSQKQYFHRKLSSDKQEAVKYIFEGDHYFPPLKHLVTDGSKIYLYSYLQKRNLGIMTDIFDLSKMKFDGQIYIKEIIEIMQNGLLFKVDQSNPFKPKVNVYKIGNQRN